MTAKEHSEDLAKRREEAISNLENNNMKKELKHKLFKNNEGKSLLVFVNNNNDIEVVSITQARNNDYNLFYYGLTEEEKDFDNYFSYLIVYENENEWVTTKVNKEGTKIMHKQGIDLPIERFLLSYKHLFHDEEMTVEQLNKKLLNNDI